MSKTNPLEAAAIWYARRGWAVFPCRPRDKRPLTRNGFKAATTDLDQITGWWANFPRANVAIACGASGLLVIDVDVDHARGKFGDESLDELERELGPLPETAEQLTGGGGRQLFFRAFEGSYSTTDIRPGIDIRGQGGYVVVPPSVHPSGRKYEWEVTHTPFRDVEVAELPDAWREWLLSQRGRAREKEDKEQEDRRTKASEVLKGVEEGRRDETLFKYACRLRQKGLTYDEALELVQIAAGNCTPPFPKGEARKKVVSAWRYEGPQEHATHVAALELSLDAASIREMVETPPPRLKWLLKGSLLRETAGLIVAPGGFGKSYLLIQLAAAVASRATDFLGLYEIEHPGKVFCLFAEDPNAVIHHRIHAILNAYPEGVRKHMGAILAENLFILSGVGADTRLVKMSQENIEPTHTYFALLDFLKGIEDLALVILDPLSHLGDAERDHATGAFFLQLCQRIATETGATVLVAHHTNKNLGNAEGTKALVQDAARGSSALTNAARWQMNLARPAPADMRRHGLDPETVFRTVCGKVTKKNAGPPEQIFFLTRDETTGLLRRAEPDPNAKADDAELRERIIETVASLQAPMGKRTFCAEFAGVFDGVGRPTLEKTINRMIAERELAFKAAINVQGKEIMALCVPGEVEDPPNENAVC